MLRTIASLGGYTIQALDNELGSLTESYLDDIQWGVRYLVVDIGSWMSRRQALISPRSIKALDDARKMISLSLTTEQIRHSPNIDIRQAVTRHAEADLARYYDHQIYWTGPATWGAEPYPTPRPPVQEDLFATMDEQQDGYAMTHSAASLEEVHLHRGTSACGYGIVGMDGDIGHIKDFIFDDQTWAIHYLLVRVHRWWPGGEKILVPTQRIVNIDRIESIIQIDFTRDQVKDLPRYDVGIGSKY